MSHTFLHSLITSNLEYGNTQADYMKLGIWEHKNHPIWEYGKTEKMKLGTGNKAILKFELGNLHPPPPFNREP